MAENKLKIQHLRSKELVDGKPKLPTELDEGEIAINFANGHETIAIKNDRNQIVKFDNKVDENYEPTQYNGKFETLVTETNHVKAGDTNSKAFKSVENTMSTLVDEVYKNEKAIVTTCGTVGSATGIVDAEGNISYQTKADAHYIASATSVHDATVKLDNKLGEIAVTVSQWCPISLDFVELNGIKWLKYDFNAFIGHTYQWGSLGDETKSPFPLSDTSGWNAIKSIVAPLSSMNEDEASVERSRLLSPSFDIIYHLTHGHARMARELEYDSLNKNNIQQVFRIGIGPVVSPKWNFSYKENPNNFITLDAGVYKPAEIGAMVTVSNTNNSGQVNSAIRNGSSSSYEGRIMGVLIK